jgi:poly(3-hydroxyalkanoate) synthetase
LSWSGSSPIWKSGPDLSTLPASLKQSILREALSRQQSLLDGVRHYLRYSHAPSTYPAPPETVWQRHAARLYHYPAHRQGGHPLLVIPSLINRYYILDLSEERSLVRHLAAQGHDVYLLDWGTPGAAEQGFGLADYVETIIAPAAEQIIARHGLSPAVIGYCMGGLLAIMLAHGRPELCRAMALLATPWHFHAEDCPRMRLPENKIPLLRNWLASLPYLPGEVMLYLFYLRDPWRFEKKFREFPNLPDHATQQYFSAIEQWANDCVPLPRRVAAESFIDCQYTNQPYVKRWAPTGVCIDAATIAHPTLIVAPHNDRIVPPGSALGLAAQLPHATVHQPHTGHIGMITGARRHPQLWEPLSAWLAARA